MNSVSKMLKKSKKMQNEFLEQKNILQKSFCEM